ncbi:MAG: phosphoribosylamine--glycine ligase [Armatimonadia bacterium]|nr:phosphoribosylamine--glycine ligase [Armatimonadia bacterium]
MKVLVVGGGGREHALAWRIAQEGDHRVYGAPGNPGIARIGQNVDLTVDRIGEMADFAREQGIDFTIVGPEAPLIDGMVDEFIARGLKVFGPKRAAARIEGSKVFAKNLMRRHKIPTADFDIFDNAADARTYIEKKGAPIVVKADGAAAGKGAIVCQDVPAALDAVERIMEERVFGSAGDRLVVEEFMVGQEMSLLFFTDGETVVPLEPARDYKAARDGDEGPNTGGMGCYSPVPLVDDSLRNETMDRIVKPTIQGLLGEGIRFRGILYVGLMLTNKGLQVLEFNARFGDPETQVQMPRLDTPLIEILQACSSGRLHEIDVRWKTDAAVCVVMASGGYPGRYERGKVITGVQDAEADEGVVVFHAGTKMDNGNLLSDGGRVLGVTAAGPKVADARDKAYQATARIHFEGSHSRKDIAAAVSN